MIKHLKKTKDKFGNELDIFFQDTIVQCPALSSFLRVFAELVDSDLSMGQITFNNKCRMVWAQQGETVLGGICYEYKADSKSGWIVLSFTNPESRGREINSICHEVMEDDIKKLGGERIASLVHVNNIKRQNSAKKVGMVPQFYRMNKELK